MRPSINADAVLDCKISVYVAFRASGLTLVSLWTASHTAEKAYEDVLRNSWRVSSKSKPTYCLDCRTLEIVSPVGIFVILVVAMDMLVSGSRQSKEEYLNEDWIEMKFNEFKMLHAKVRSSSISTAYIMSHMSHNLRDRKKHAAALLVLYLNEYRGNMERNLKKRI